MADIYYNKYLKYKAKYLELLKSFEGGAGKLVSYRTISNSGRIGKYERQCIWISIMDYLNKYYTPPLDHGVTIDEIRAIAIGDENNSLDYEGLFDTYENFNALQNVIINFNLNIKFYIRETKNSKYYINDIPSYTIGNESSHNILHIVNYDDWHFELITEINDIKLYESKQVTRPVTRPDTRPDTRPNKTGTISKIESKIEQELKLEYSIETKIKIKENMEILIENLRENKKMLEEKIKDEKDLSKLDQLNKRLITNNEQIKTIENQMKEL